MPSLNDAISTNLSGYSPVKAPSTPSTPSPAGLEPTLNTVIRCPLPPIFQAQPDSLRQFYQGGKVPQTRLLSAATNGINGGGGGSGNAVVSTTIVPPSGSNPPPVQVVAQQATVTTTVLGPGQQFTGILKVVSESFQLLGVTTSTQARVTIYGTAFAQIADLSRGVDQPPPAGSTQNIITDVVIDTLPYQWTFQNRIGSNGESPQKPQAYITITNLSAAAIPVTATVIFIPLES